MAGSKEPALRRAVPSRAAGRRVSPPPWRRACRRSSTRSVAGLARSGDRSRAPRRPPGARRRRRRRAGPGRALRRGLRARRSPASTGCPGRSTQRRTALRPGDRRRRGAHRSQPGAARRGPPDAVAAAVRRDAGAGAAHPVVRGAGTAGGLGRGGGAAHRARSAAGRDARGGLRSRRRSAAAQPTSTPRSTTCARATRPSSRRRCGTRWRRCPIAIACCCGSRP